MSVQSFDLGQITPKWLKEQSLPELKKLSLQLLTMQQVDRKEHQLFYYQPASESVFDLHRSVARKTCVGAGNGASKTESCLVELLVHCTGVIPFSLRDIGIDWKKKLRGPIQARVICENITTVLHTVILKKLQWYHWTGIDVPGGQRGHWGWIPRHCLIDGDWAKSWSEKTRLLRVLYRNPDNFEEVLGESSIQFMSYDQDPKDFESGDLHFVHLDEPPPLRIFRANEARTMRVNGRMLLSFTWPDDPSINVDWIFDELYEPSRPGPAKSDQIDWVELSTLKNQFLDQASVSAQAAAWDDRMRAVRIEGKPIRFSNRVHELFTDVPQDWCFQCGEPCLVVTKACLKCGSEDVESFCHVEEFEHESNWPVLWILDPHPRKPHMSAYLAITPDDEVWQVAELEVDDDPTEVRIRCEELEREFRLSVRQRLMDPKMGAQPSGAQRTRTWLDEFIAAGLPCDPADAADVGRGLVDEYLRPDASTRRPRIKIHPRCSNTILQFKRFMWDDWKLGSDKDQKQTAKRKYDDYPAIWRYGMNARPSYESLVRGYRAISCINRGSKPKLPLRSRYR